MRSREQEHEIKPIIWIRSLHKDLKEFPPEIQDEIGYTLYVAQIGDKHPKAKPLKEFPGIMQVRSDYATNTYRAVYTNPSCYLQNFRRAALVFIENGP